MNNFHLQQTTIATNQLIDKHLAGDQSNVNSPTTTVRNQVTSVCSHSPFVPT